MAPALTKYGGYVFGTNVQAMIEYHESGEDVSGNTKRLGGNTTQNPEALKWQYKPTAVGRRFVLAHFRADG